HGLLRPAHGGRTGAGRRRRTLSQPTRLAVRARPSPRAARATGGSSLHPSRARRRPRRAPSLPHGAAFRPEPARPAAAPPWRLLRDSPGDREHAGSLLEEARTTYRELGMELRVAAAVPG